jgi:hypothetical protein
VFPAVIERRQLAHQVRAADFLFFEPRRQRGDITGRGDRID